MDKRLVLDEIIIAYRTLITERYQYSVLKEQYSFPDSISEENVTDIKNYFLTYIYPDVNQRAILNEAFATLDNFIKNPQKLLNLAFDSFQLIFSHGKHLPKIFNSGITAIKSFRGATKFEKAIVKKAIDNNIEPPYSTATIIRLIQYLSYDEIEEFMNNTENFFNIIYDKIMVKKIKEIITFMISKMENKSNTFNANEVSSLKLALETISKGEQMLNKLTPKDQEILVNFVLKIEKDKLNEIFIQ